MTNVMDITQKTLPELYKMHYTMEKEFNQMQNNLKVVRSRIEDLESKEATKKGEPIKEVKSKEEKK